MTEEEKMNELWRKVAEYKEISPNSHFDEQEFWKKLQKKLEKKGSSTVKWAMGCLIAVLIITTGIALNARVHFKPYENPVYKEDIRIGKKDSATMKMFDSLMGKPVIITTDITK